MYSRVRIGLRCGVAEAGPRAAVNRFVQGDDYAPYARTGGSTVAGSWTVSSVLAAVWLVLFSGSSPQRGAAAARPVEAPPSAEVLLRHLKSMSLGHPRLLFEDVRKAPGWKDPERRAAAVRDLVPAVERIYMKKDLASPQARELDKASAAST